MTVRALEIYAGAEAATEVRRTLKITPAQVSIQEDRQLYLAGSCSACRGTEIRHGAISCTGQVGMLSISPTGRGSIWRNSWRAPLGKGICSRDVVWHPSFFISVTVSELLDTTLSKADMEKLLEERVNH